MVRKPNFVIAGAPRSGTTTLYSYLEQHPEICFSYIKEPNYFSLYYDLGESWYLSLFYPSRKINFLKKVKNIVKYDFTSKPCKKCTVIGEASTRYMANSNAPKRMYEFNPDFKIIFLLRDPVYRAFSNYKREIQITGITDSFEETIKNSHPRRYEYVERGNYYTHISRYLKFFPRKQIYIMIFEEFILNADSELRKLLHFLEVDENFKFDHDKIKKNISVAPISYSLQRSTYKYFSLNLRNPEMIELIKYLMYISLNKLNHCFGYRKMPKLEEFSKQYLKTYYKNEISQLENLIGRKLTLWK